MEKFLPVILYGMDLVKYYIGNKLFFEGKMKRPWIAIVGGLGLFFVLSVFSVKGVGANVFAYFFAVVAAGIMVEGKIGTKIIRMVWLYSVVTSLDEMMMIIHDGIIENFNEEIKYIVGSISTVILLGTAGFILKHLQNKISNKKVLFGGLYTILIMICICVGFSISGIQYMYIMLPKELRVINLDYLTIISLLAIALLIVLIFYIQKLYSLLEQTAQTERNLKQIQATYYQSLLDKEEETRRYRHDMHNHLLYIREMAKSEGAEKTKQYADRLEESWGSIGRNQYETGNMVLNILLNHYLANLKDIKISVCGVCKRELRLDEVDLCTIFSNLIQNAAEELKGRKEGYFALEIEQGQENTRITVRNSTDLLLAKDNQELTSSKQDKKNHGIGLKNVKQIVEHYNGDISWSAEGKEFRVMVTMKI